MALSRSNLMNRFCLKEMIWVFSFVTRELPLRCMLVFLPTEISARKRPQNQLENMRLKFCVYLESWISNRQFNCSDVTRHNFLKIFRVFYVTWIEKYIFYPWYSKIFISAESAFWFIWQNITKRIFPNMRFGLSSVKSRKQQEFIYY